jgi:hypothetical protein
MAVVFLSGVIMKSSLIKSFWILILVPVLLTGCAFGACKKEAVNQAHTTLLTQLKNIPDFTQPDHLMHLSAVDLEGATDAIWEVEVPDCMAVAQFYAANAMYYAGEALSLFQLEGDSEAFQDALETSQTFLNNFDQEMERIQGCLPFCAPTSIDE